MSFDDVEVLILSNVSQWWRVGSLSDDGKRYVVSLESIRPCNDVQVFLLYGLVKWGLEAR